MNKILLIDTAVTTASVCIAEDEKLIIEKMNPSQKDHASWIHQAIKDAVKEAGTSLNDITAVALSAGPGSYTGLRVGMSTAKGICYSLNKPLITINTLQMMAAAAIESGETATYLCPMIDARRMEVFTAVFDQEMNEILPQTNMILDENSFSSIIQKEKTCFFGNGSSKFLSLIHHENVITGSIKATASNMISMAFFKLNKAIFADTAYTEPNYGKEFYLPSVNSVLSE